MKILLWIDDIRNPIDFITTDSYESVVWATTFHEGINALNKMKDIVTDIHLDNDLNDPNDYQGKHVFNVIEEYLYNEQLPVLSNVFVHSDNSSAVHSMMLAKDNMKYKFGVNTQQIIFKSN